MYLGALIFALAKSMYYFVMDKVLMMVFFFIRILVSSLEIQVNILFLHTAHHTHICYCQVLFYLRWLKTVSSTKILMGCYSHSLSLAATIMVSKNCPTIGEHVVVLFIA